MVAFRGLRAAASPLALKGERAGRFTSDVSRGDVLIKLLCRLKDDRTIEPFALMYLLLDLRLLNYDAHIGSVWAGKDSAFLVSLFLVMTCA